ncbi:MAG: UDP-N-acetylglucosamine 1-carboxyvinyltransferase [Pyramidobacter sp.]|nr:UDP-N-acetylglucosamine 1-carboxyvinyltransferase [Pyramidobacter sp.]MBQ8090647.1 UDP-N-acetylglucosamine 1-carboxyvinyltransferase [Pyramidobacter sp.]
MESSRYLKITGGAPLHGSIRIQGSKNAALPVVAAGLLLGQGQTLTCTNVPLLRDTETMAALLRELGMTVTFENGTVTVTRNGDLSCEMPAVQVQKMRASSIVLGPLLAQQGRAVMPMPGGCTIGARPIDLHLKGLAKMGAQIELHHGAVYATAEKLRGCRIYLDFPSVGATENLVMAAALAEGETIIENAAREPEITNLVQALQAMGADVVFKKDNQGIIQVNGKPELASGTVKIVPDRIAACTYLLAGAITNGEVTVTDVMPQHFDSLLAKLEEAEVGYLRQEDRVTVYPSRGRMKSLSVKTMPYPGFPTDVQPQLMAALCLAHGTSVVKESIFESRFQHVPELRKMGAEIDIQGNTAVIRGVEALNGSDVQATDLRAGAALALAGLAAEGETRVHGLKHILRGYEDFDKALTSLGAHVSIEEGESIA